MKAEFIPEQGRYMVYPGGDNYLMDNKLWDQIAELMSKAFPKYQIVMGVPYDYGRSTVFAVVDMYRTDGRLRMKERYIYTVKCEWVR